MSLQEFDSIIERMDLALDYAENLGQYIDAARILFQMNDHLPDTMQLQFEELESPDDAKSFVMSNKPRIKNQIVEYRQLLMINS